MYTGIDPKAHDDLPAKGAFANRYGLSGERIIAYIGRLNACKGLDHLLRAFRDVASSDRETVLVMVGPDDGYRRTLERLTRALALGDRVVFTGFLGGRDRLAAFVDSDMIVYPAKYEIFGLVPFEALACGKPVVVADDSGCGEIVREARAGLVVPVEDGSRLARAISVTLQGGREISQMVETGKRFVEDQLNWDAIATQTEKVYEEVVDGRPSTDDVHPRGDIS